jgi:hypothetical protein
MSDTTAPNDVSLSHAAATFLAACSGLTAHVMGRLPADKVEEVTSHLATGDRCGFEGTVDWTGSTRIHYVAIAPDGTRTFLAQVHVPQSAPATVQ